MLSRVTNTQARGPERLLTLVTDGFERLDQCEFVDRQSVTYSIVANICVLDRRPRYSAEDQNARLTTSEDIMTHILTRFAEGRHLWVWNRTR